MEKNQKKHDTEKQKALTDFDNYKIKMTDMIQRINKDYKEKYDTQEDTIIKMTKKFQDKILVFESINTDLTESIKKSKSTSSMGLDEMKNKFESEIDELIRFNNENSEKISKLHMKEQGKLLIFIILSLSLFVILWAKF